MTDALRLEVLIFLDDHSKRDSSTLLDDQAISAALRRPLQEVQRQLDILETQGLVELAKSFGPSYAARILPKGALLVEEVRAAQKSPRKRPMGFDPKRSS